MLTIAPSRGGGGGYSGFQVTGILSKDLFGFEIFDSYILFGGGGVEKTEDSW